MNSPEQMTVNDYEFPTLPIAHRLLCPSVPTITLGLFKLETNFMNSELDSKYLANTASHQ